ncbi:VOC family protein [Nocardia transvalensis]|uniref:VOC family protein n=1 Tax=Nocardia transvalensis TaxID=37333 RepID=UPI001893FF72|nr:VOC family protein [Nocardia transvalensis]MBF6327002.1 VOC family protein [Nocardia transvalensis]
MSTEGFEAVFVETHNWGKAARFFQALGFEPEFTTDHNSGLFRNGEGPYLFLAEVPADHEPRVQIALKVADAREFRPGPDVEVVQPFEDTHYGTQEAIIRDPDGHLWNLQAPGKES